MLCNSRLNNGSIETAQIDPWAEQYGYTRIEYFRLIANWAVFRNFAPLADQVRALQPDVYIAPMEAEMRALAEFTPFRQVDSRV